jgi:hypothetical protein
MITDQVVSVALPSTSVVRPVLRKGQIENQNQICEGKMFVIHGPGDTQQEVAVIRGPFNQGGSRCIKLSFKRGLYQLTVSLADLSVVRYQNGTWNIDNWLGNY